MPVSDFLAEWMQRQTKPMSQAELARRLDVSRLSVNQILNKRRTITADMAIRLERVTGIDAFNWLIEQAAEDLKTARKKVKR